MALLGIDFGTATIRAVVVPSDGRPRPSDVVEVPALASFRGDSFVVGEPALMTLGAVDDPLVDDLKRMLGRPSDDPQVARLAQRAALHTRPYGADDIELCIDSSSPAEAGMSVAKACTELLRQVGELASNGQRSHQAVIAIPCWYGEAQRNALALCAARADVKVLRFIGDGFASALWAAHAYRISGSVVTIDAGAGGIGVTAAQLGDTALLSAAHGSGEMGGIDIDAELAAAAIDRADRATHVIVRRACEAMKRELGKSDSARRDVKLPSGDSRHIVVERWEMELLLAGIGNAIAACCERALAEAKLSAGSIGAVLATGGMARLPAIGGRIAASAGMITEGFPVITGPTLGAALRASYLAGRLDGPEIHDGEQQPEPGGRAERRPRPRMASPVRQVSPAQIVTRRKPVERHRPDVKRRRLDPRGRDERRSTVPPAGPGAVALDPPSIPDLPPLDIETPEAPPQRAPQRPATATPARDPRPAPLGTAVPRGIATARAVSHPSTTSRPRRPLVSGMVAASAPAAVSGPVASSGPAEASYPPAPSDAAGASAPPEPAVSSVPPDDSAPPAAPSPPPAASEPPTAGADPQRSTAGWTDERKTPAIAVEIPPASGTKYPARDGQRKYPARDRGPRVAIPPPQLERQASRRATQVGIPSPQPRTTPISSVPPGAGDSIPPDAMRSIIPAPQMPTEGSLYLPEGATAIMSLAITRPLEPADLDPIALPVLLRRLMGRRSISGTLVIEAERTLPIDVEGGNALLTRGEHTELMQVFLIDGGRWRLENRRTKMHGREMYPLPHIALEGVRRLMRSLPLKDMIEALSHKVHMAPRLLPERASVPKRLGLSGRERRFIDDYIDGEASAMALSKLVILGAQTAFQVLGLLELYGALEWLPSADGGRISNPGSIPPGTGSSNLP